MAALIDRVDVNGAGVGGLFAAAALSRHAEAVVVVDRDDIPTGHTVPTPRDGTPRSRHPHLLLFGGLDAMCDWVRTAWALAAAADFTDSRCTGDYPAADMPDVERLEPSGCPQTRATASWRSSRITPCRGCRQVTRG